MKDENLCRQHSGFNSRIENTERSITELWLKMNLVADMPAYVKTNKERLKDMEIKMNGMQKIALGIMITLTFNLVGVIIAVALLYLRTK